MGFDFHILVLAEAKMCLNVRIYKIHAILYNEHAKIYCIVCVCVCVCSEVGVGLGYVRGQTVKDEKGYVCPSSTDFKFSQRFVYIDGLL